MRMEIMVRKQNWVYVGAKWRAQQESGGGVV